MAAVTPRTHEQIQHELQLIHPEIPVDQLQRFLEEHNYDTVVVEAMLHPPNTQYRYGQLNMNHPHRDPYTRMERQQSPNSRGDTARPGRSMSTDNSHTVGLSYGYRAQPEGSMDLPRFHAEGRHSHHRSRTADEPGWEFVPRDLPQKQFDTLHVNTQFTGSQPNSPRASPRYHDRGMWVPPRKEAVHRSEASVNLSQPEARPAKQLEPWEMVHSNLMTTQLLPPPMDQSTPHSTPQRPSKSLSVEESYSGGGRCSPLILPLDLITPEPSPGGVNNRRKTSREGDSPGTRQQPVNHAVADWSHMSSPLVNPKSPPYIVSSISSPVSSPKISMKYMQNPLEVRKNNSAASPRLEPVWSMPPLPDAHGESSMQTNNIGLELKKQSRIQALLAHQKARYSFMEKRVNETRRETETMRQELTQMENELSARTQMPSVATPDAISRLRDEKQRLQIDIEVLSRDIMYLSKQRAGNHSQDEFGFYPNMPDQSMYNQHIPLPSQPNRTPPSDLENNAWSCRRCSFANHQFLTECEMCGCQRDSLVSAGDHN